MRERLLSFNHFLVYSFANHNGDSTKERKRAQIAQAVVPPSRLMALIGQALKWQQHQGAILPQFDLFRGTAAMKQDVLSPDGQLLRSCDHQDCSDFSRDRTQLLSTSVDHTARIHGLKSGKIVERVWDSKTTDCLQTFKPTTFTKRNCTASAIYQTGGLEHFMMVHEKDVIGLITPPT
ncbi:Suppressor of mec-8 and unc-52 protein-like protein 1 [Raphanus sativus]|nr:Suppressor of mec-8 and unc-52 protein-like protein 1 [Raphanus sativus]